MRRPPVGAMRRDSVAARTVGRHQPGSSTSASNYTSTAANNEIYTTSQTQNNALQDMKGPSSFDSPYALTVTTSYRSSAVSYLPRPLAKLTQAWVLSAVVVARSGTPFTVTTGSDAPGFGNVDGQGSDRPNILNPSILGATVGNPDTSTQTLNRANFGYLAIGQSAGTLSNNAFRKGAILNLNGSVSRDWRFLGDLGSGSLRCTSSNCRSLQPCEPSAIRRAQQ